MDCSSKNDQLRFITKKRKRSPNIIIEKSKEQEYAQSTKDQFFSNLMTTENVVEIYSQNSELLTKLTNLNQCEQIFSFKLLDYITPERLQHNNNDIEEKAIQNQLLNLKLISEDQICRDEIIMRVKMNEIAILEDENGLKYMFLYFGCRVIMKFFDCEFKILRTEGICLKNNNGITIEKNLYKEIQAIDQIMSNKKEIEHKNIHQLVSKIDENEKLKEHIKDLSRKNEDLILQLKDSRDINANLKEKNKTILVFEERLLQEKYEAMLKSLLNEISSSKMEISKLQQEYEILLKKCDQIKNKIKPTNNKMSKPTELNKSSFSNIIPEKIVNIIFNGVNHKSSTFQIIENVMEGKREEEYKGLCQVCEIHNSDNDLLSCGCFFYCRLCYDKNVKRVKKSGEKFIKCPVCKEKTRTYTN